MIKCTDFQELISALADGELKENDRLRTLEHLDACAGCSALLEIYQEISHTVDQSLVPAPAALRENVMQKILSGKADADAGTAERLKKLKFARTVATRYVPLAACIVVMLTTLPRLSNFGCSSSAPDRIEMSVPADAPSQTQNFSLMTEEADRDEVLPAEVFDETQISRNDNASDMGDVFVPIAPEANASRGQSAVSQALPEPPNEPEEESRTPVAVIPDAPIAAPDAPAPVTSDAPDTVIPGAPAPPNTGTADETAEAKDSGSQADIPAQRPEAGGIVRPGGGITTEDDFLNRPEPVPAPDLGPADEPDIITAESYAVVMIAGEIPEIFAEYADATAGGDQYYVIMPRERTRQFIAEYGGTIVNLGDIADDGSAKIIYWTP